MVFSSPFFLFIFLPIVLVGYFILPRLHLKNLWLLAASLFFYGWGEPKCILLLLVSMMFNYGFGLFLGATREWPGKHKAVLVAALVYNLGILLVFKYTGFFVKNINALLHLQLSVPNIALPIGISFYTFQILSYVIDVYRGKTEVQTNPLKLGLYMSLFPQLLAGPIVRYSDVTAEIDCRHTSREDFNAGAVRFMQGFIKKTMIADVVARTTDTAFASIPGTASVAWLGAIAYTIQIYFDFSGYSDMAIGIGRILGFHYLENFNFPYMSQSIQEFWRRWHISLSSWFRDYVYFPLGGSRAGTQRTYFNLFIVFLLTGFWHGASWNFIIWGLYYVVFLILERAGFNKVLDKLPRIFRHLYALFIIILGWVFFRANTLGNAVQYLATMFRFSTFSLTTLKQTFSLEELVFLLMGIVFAFPIGTWIQKRLARTPLFEIGLVACFLVAIAYMVGRGYCSFLYFRF